MTPNIDIIKDFSALQQTCNELGRSNVALAQENVRLRAAAQAVLAAFPNATLWDMKDLRKSIEELRDVIFEQNKPNAV